MTILMMVLVATGFSLREFSYDAHVSRGMRIPISAGDHPRVIPLSILNTDTKTKPKLAARRAALKSLEAKVCPFSSFWKRNLIKAGYSGSSLLAMAMSPLAPIAIEFDIIIGDANASACTKPFSSYEMGIEGETNCCKSFSSCAKRCVNSSTSSPIRARSMWCSSVSSKGMNTSCASSLDVSVSSIRSSVMSDSRVVPFFECPFRGTSVSSSDEAVDGDSRDTNSEVFEDGVCNLIFPLVLLWEGAYVLGTVGSGDVMV